MVLLRPYSSRAAFPVDAYTMGSKYTSVGVTKRTPEELIAVMYISNQHIKAAVYVLVPDFQFRGCCSPSSSQQILLSPSTWTPFPCTASSSEPFLFGVFSEDACADEREEVITLESLTKRLG